jgi:hypothetical protein
MLDLHLAKLRTNKKLRLMKSAEGKIAVGEVLLYGLFSSPVVLNMKHAETDSI